MEPAKVEPEEGEETDDEEPEEPSLPVDCKGIPEFWLTCFKNSPVLEAMIAEHDEGALAYLEDVRVAFLDGNPVCSCIALQMLIA